MNRWTSVSLCSVVLLLVLTQSQAQPAPGAIQGSEAAYPHSSEGLQQLRGDFQ
jgi:hypothetical protein